MTKHVAVSGTAVRQRWLATSVLILLLAALSGLHWVKNPFRLSVWVHANDPGSLLLLESSCADPNSGSRTHRQPITPGYFEYQLPLPRCIVTRLELSTEPEPDTSMAVAAAAITYYGKVVTRLVGPARTRTGELHTTETPPARSEAESLVTPLVLQSLDLDLVRGPISWPRWFLLVLIPIAAVLLIRQRSIGCERKEEQTGPVAYPLFLVAILCFITSAAVSARTDLSVNPDELSHAASAQYYYDHWLKPKIGDPKTLDAHNTNRYGISYLTSTDPVYLLAGKFAVLAWPIFGNDVVALRIFNVSLFFFLLVLALRDSIVQLASIPIIGTPQAWYVFSYFNGDAFPLFLSTLAVVAILRPGGKPDPRNLSRRAIISGVLVGLVFLSKTNYWTILGFLVLCIIAREGYLKPRSIRLLIFAYLVSVVGALYLSDRWHQQTCSHCYLPGAIAPVIVLAMALIAFRHAINRIKSNADVLRAVFFGALAAGATMFPLLAYDWVTNGPPFSSARSEAIRAVMEATADDDHKPSSIESGHSAPNMRLHQKGLRLKELLVDRQWLRTSLRSFLGVYGYMNIWPPRGIFPLNAIAFLILSFLAVLLASRQMAKERIAGIPLAISAGLVTIVTAAVSFSWFYDFQPQGRYLLPALPVFSGALVLAGVEAHSNKTLRIAALAAFCASALSFVLVYLSSIPKMPGKY